MLEALRMHVEEDTNEGTKELVPLCWKCLEKILNARPNKNID
jgi:hypothetical protein